MCRRSGKYVYFSCCIPGFGDSPVSEFYVATFRNFLSIPSVVFFILGDSALSEFYVPTFRNILSIPSVVFSQLSDSPASQFI
jgi:hypothetical protein